MARSDAGTMFRSLPSDQRIGEYNRITKVPSSTTFHATGSNAGAGFIVEVVTNVVIHAAGGGTLPSSAMLVDTVYPIGVKKVVIGSSGIVHVLHR
jgi:predicted ThiF/HesA family dinucleotide-utilizing enzyme